MYFKHSFLQIINPSVPKRYLLLVSALIWTFAGGMLLFRGISILRYFNTPNVPEEAGCVIAGILFYVFIFSTISLKHINRILNLPIEQPGIFLFFNKRSYVMMALMISCGISLRMSRIVPIEYLSLFYIAMGTPLIMSALRFYYYGAKAIYISKKDTDTNTIN